MKKKYACLIFDADHTLLNYIADEKRAFCSLYAKLGMPITSELLAHSRIASETAWTEAGLYNVTEPAVQRQYHVLYRTHTEDIFQRIFARFPCETCSAKEAGLQFLEELKIVGEPLGDALDVLKRLSDKAEGKYAVYIATNGLADIQHKRLESFAPFVRGIYASEDVQSVKPLPDFFERILEETGVAPDCCLMIGDSLISDIMGAKAVGMDTCWLNARALTAQNGIADMEIHDLNDLLKIL